MSRGASKPAAVLFLETKTRSDLVDLCGWTVHITAKDQYVCAPFFPYSCGDTSSCACQVNTFVRTVATLQLSSQLKPG